MSGISSCSWVTILSALLTPMIAISTSLIAYRQWRTAKNKLKLDLFDRRLAIYNAVCDALASDQPLSADEERKFLVSTRDAKWLFSRDIQEYFREDLFKKFCEFQALDKRYGSLPNGLEREVNLSQQEKIKLYLSDQQKVLDTQIYRFLKMPT